MFLRIAYLFCGKGYDHVSAGLEYLRGGSGPGTPEKGV